MGRERTWDQRGGAAPPKLLLCGRKLLLNERILTNGVKALENPFSAHVRWWDPDFLYVVNS